jgi:general stress protein YciG
MAGTRAGGLKCAQINLAKNPNHYRDIALKAQESWAKNGKKPRGFSCDKERARLAGAKGGKTSSRKKV